jgi:hypothetical protein
MCNRTAYCVPTSLANFPNTDWRREQSRFGEETTVLGVGSGMITAKTRPFNCEVGGLAVLR